MNRVLRFLRNESGATGSLQDRDPVRVRRAAAADDHERPRPGDGDDSGTDAILEGWDLRGPGKPGANNSDADDFFTQGRALRVLQLTTTLTRHRLLKYR